MKPKKSSPQEQPATKKDIFNIENQLNLLRNDVKEEIKELDDKWEKRINELIEKIDKTNTFLDWFTGKYKKLEEEQILLSNKNSDHEERVEILEKKINAN